MAIFSSSIDSHCKYWVPDKVAWVCVRVCAGVFIMAESKQKTITLGVPLLSIKYQSKIKTTKKSKSAENTFN